MLNAKPKRKCANVKTWIDDLPHLLGLPVLDNDLHEKNNRCHVQAYFSLLIFCFSLFLLFLPKDIFSIFTYILSFNPNSILLGKIIGSITANFIHGNFLHLFGNIYFFLLFAPLVEKKYGPYNFLIVFFLCSIASNMAPLFYTKQVSIGASGMISGLMGLIATARPNLKFCLYKFIKIPCWLLIFSLYFIPDISKELTLRQMGATDHINHLAHIFGFMSGAILSFFLIPINETERAKQLNDLSEVNLDWLKSGRLWGEVFLAFFVPFIFFFIYEKNSLEKTLYVAMNIFIYFYIHPYAAIFWAVPYIFVQHKNIGDETIHASKHLSDAKVKLFVPDKFQK